jgi:CRP/FNR family transcriptional regulator
MGIGVCAVTTRELQHEARRWTFPKGVELFRQGEQLSHVLYLERGTVKLTRVDENGRENIVELAFAGSWLGTAAVIARLSTPITAVTCEETVTAQIPSDAFTDLIQRDTTLSRCFHEFHASELCRHAGWITQLSSRTSRERLQQVIRQLISALKLNTSSGDIRLRLPFQQWELAQLIAITPEHLSRVLREMADEGVIRRHKGWIVVSNLQQLGPE